MPVDSIIDNKWAFWDIEKTPPYYIDMLPWWEFEEYIKKLNDKIKKENEQNKESNAGGTTPKIPDYSKKLPNVDSMMRQVNKFK